MPVVGIDPYAPGTHSSVPARSLPAFVALAKKQAGVVPHASAGSGAGTPLAMALFAARAGIQMNHIPSKGGSMAVSGVLGGQFAACCGKLVEILPHARSGRVRGLHLEGAAGPGPRPPAANKRVVSETAAVAKDPVMIKRQEAIGVDSPGNTRA